MLKLPLIFKNHMVLQRDKQISIWGDSRPNDIVEINLQNKSYSCVANEEGKWEIKCGPFNTSWKETLVIATKDDCITFDDVAIGDVWLASGQSNMQFYMRYEKHYNQEIETELNSDIRYFEYPPVTYDEQLEKADYLQYYGFWRPCNKENLEYYGAVAYYFGKAINQSQNVPIGLINCSRGGVVITTWMSHEAIVKGKGDVWLDNYNRAIKDMDIEAYNRAFDNEKGNFKTYPFSDAFTDKMLYGFTREEQLEMMSKKDQEEMKNDVGPEKVLASSMGPRNKNAPSVLYNSMIKNIVPYTLKGIIWYQGESDCEHHEPYKTLFVSLIESWRQLWNEHLPFIYVQLAPFGEWLGATGEKFTFIREAQQWVSEHVSNVGMAVISDVGMQWDIHPKDKKTVGERLSLHARKLAYHEDIEAEAPYLVDAKWQNEGITLIFKHADNGLVLEGDTINGLIIKQTEKEVTDYTFNIKENTIEIQSESFQKDSEIEVSIGWMGYCQMNLYNTHHLPARQAMVKI